MRVWALVLALGGCGFPSLALPSNGQDGGGELPPGDGPATDSGSDGGVVHICLGRVLQICANAPRTALTLMTGVCNAGVPWAIARCLPYSATPPEVACVIAGQATFIPAGNTVSV